MIFEKHYRDLYDDEVEKYPTKETSDETGSGANYVLRESINNDYRDRSWRAEKTWRKLDKSGELLSFHLTGVDGYTPKTGHVHGEITSMQRAKLSTPEIAQDSNLLTPEAHYSGNDHNSCQHRYLKIS